MIPISDGLPARRFPFVNVALIVACFAVWLFYEIPDLQVREGWIESKLRGRRSEPRR